MIREKQVKMMEKQKEAVCKHIWAETSVEHIYFCPLCLSCMNRDLGRNKVIDFDIRLSEVKHVK